MSEVAPSQPPRAANVADLQHTPVTLGVVLAVQAVAIGAVLLIAGVLWGRLASLENKIDTMQRDVSAVREGMGELKSLLTKP